MPGSISVTEIQRADPIVFTAQGMVSSLGEDAATSCAAARAGIRRAQELDALRVASLDGRTVEPATGHAAPLITHGFEGEPRLARLAAAALRDLMTRLSFSDSERVGLYLSMPSARRHLEGAALVADPDAKQAFLEEISESEPDSGDQIRTEKVLSSAFSQAGLTRNIPCRFVTCAGHSGFAEALAVAVRELQQSGVDLAVVGGLDSLVDERTLKWLRLTGRLKGEANPTGLEPGEGAAFFAVERERRPNRPRRPVLSRILAITTAEEERSFLGGQQPSGGALSRCLQTSAITSGELWLVSDHNGETTRAMEFGNVMSRIAGSRVNMLPPLFPAAAFGDTGSASGALAVCLTQSAFLRSYAPALHAVVASVSDGSQRSSFSLGHPQVG